MSMSFDCPWKGCDREFDTELGLKMHHAKTHDESLVMKTVQCEWCDDDIKRHMDTIENNTNCFCSDVCRASWQSENVCGENHHQYEGKEIECDYCGSELVRSSSKISNLNFCDDDCHYSYKRENEIGNIDSLVWNSGEDHHQYDRVEVNCFWCGSIIKRQPNTLDRDHIFCDEDCRSSWQSSEFSGEKSPLWKGGCGEYYGSNWNEQRGLALENSNGLCEMCGLTRDDHRDQYDCDLHVHHIRPLRTFETPELANYQDNLVVVCRDCHHKVERMTPLLPHGGGMEQGQSTAQSDPTRSS